MLDDLVQFTIPKRCHSPFRIYVLMSPPPSLFNCISNWKSDIKQFKIMTPCSLVAIFYHLCSYQLPMACESPASYQVFIVVPNIFSSGSRSKFKIIFVQGNVMKGINVKSCIGHKNKNKMQWISKSPHKLVLICCLTYLTNPTRHSAHKCPSRHAPLLVPVPTEIISVYYNNKSNRKYG